MAGIAGKNILTYRTVIHLVFLLTSILFFILPFLLIIIISLTDEQSIKTYGYQLIPKQWSLEAYRYTLSNLDQIRDSYLVTAGQSVLGTFLAVLIMALCAYSLSRSNFALRKPITVYLLITMLFSGGLVPSYILNTQYLKLGNNFWIYVLPFLVSVFYIIIFRTYFQGLPVEIIESAKMDGIGEFGLFARIVLPLSVPVVATISFMFLLDRWNDWFTSLVYIRNPRLYTLQYLLQKILMEMEFLRQLAVDAPGISSENYQNFPSEGMRYVMAIVAAGPMLVIFPLFQKYFVQGLTIGAVKG